MHKTIVFCRDIEHAEEMRRALINANGDLFSQNTKYIMRITGDSREGKQELDNFIDPNEPYPVIVTTSKLLNTGVDTQTVQVIVLDSIINSMTAEERRAHHILNGSRRKRISRGSGRPVQEINRLLKQYVDMRKMMKSLSRGIMPRIMRGMRFPG